MGRGRNMKGRPGLLFIFFICVCLFVFYFSWRKLMSPRFDQKSEEKVFHESGNLPRSNGEIWKFRQQFEDLHQNKQRPYRFQENQLKMPLNEDPREDEKSLKSDKSDLLDRYANSRKRPNIDKSETVFWDRKDVDTKTRSVVSTPVPKRSLSLDEKNFFFDPIESIQQHVNGMERLVHLDFKGAVPNLKYLEEIIPLFKRLGATGLLVEYEDMFPFSDTLEPLKAGNAFTQEQLKEFLQMAKKQNLKVMPLIQTFGHMEFVLKSAFSQLRESSYTPQVIDMTNNSSYKVLSAMIQQVLDAHPDVSHLHIGCDEVYELGRGASAIVMQEKGLNVHQMFLQHVKKLAQMVLSYKPRKVVPVMWDDMLRKIPLSDIVSVSLPPEVEIMVWHYTPNVTGYVKKENFEKYSKLFKSVWIASSFKGATGSRQFYTEPLYHLKNHVSWLEVIEQYRSSLSFKGVALTGWQRYDHFATLCELIPVAVPSLAVCLAALKNAGFTKEIYESTSKVLKCDDNIPMTFPEIDNKTKLAIVTQDCSFPGSDVFYSMQALYGYTQISVQPRLDGWLSDYQVSRGFTSPGQLKVLAMALNKQNNGYTKLTGPLQLHLSSIFSPEDVEEWLEENIYERKRHNVKVLTKVNNLLKRTAWPNRPLLSIKQVQEPNIPQQSKMSSTNTSVEPRQNMGSRLRSEKDLSRSGQVRKDLDTKERYSVSDSSFNIEGRVSQNQMQSNHNENNGAKSHQDNNKQFGFKRRSGKFFEDSERKENTRNLAQKIDTAQAGSRTGFNRDHVQERLSVDPSNHTFLENKFRKNMRASARNHDHDNLDTHKITSINEGKARKPVVGNREQIVANKNPRSLNNQMSESRDASENLQHKTQLRKDISQANTSADQQRIQSFSKKRRPILGKSDMLDFHDEKMERYEDKLI